MKLSAYVWEEEPLCLGKVVEKCHLSWLRTTWIQIKILEGTAL